MSIGFCRSVFVTPAPPPSFLRRQEPRSSQARSERRPQPYLRIPSPGSGVRRYRHTRAAPWRLPASPPSFLRRQESRSTQAHSERRPQPYPGCRCQNPVYVSPSFPRLTVVPASPPSFLRRQESRSTQARSKRRPQPDRGIPSPGSGVRRGHCDSARLGGSWFLPAQE